MKTFLFPGQGSQAKGMGKECFDEYRDLTSQADGILGYSIKDLCLKDPKKELGQTQFTQPALYVVNALSYFKKTEESGKKPDFLAGHSLGEFNALLAAECFDFETGLRLVIKRGELMSQATEGGMAAIVNATQEQIETILEENGLTEIDIANYNAPSQIVVSGSKGQIGKAQAFFQKGKMKFIPLNTSGAFHSRFMQPAKEKFETFLKDFEFAPLKIPVISNVSARPYQDGEVVANLSRQITGSVRWTESIQYLMALGKQKSNSHAADPMEFEEIGHGKVLTGLVQKIPKETPASAVAKPQQALTAQERVSMWNQNYPVGTRVKSAIIEGDDLETRTEAVVLFQHRPAVYLKGYKGYFDLEEITPL